jgi:hypothetical protein
LILISMLAIIASLRARRTLRLDGMQSFGFIDYEHD